LKVGILKRREGDIIIIIFFLSFITFVVVWLEVFLLPIFDVVLFVVLYNLFRPELQPQCFGFSTAMFTFAAVLPMLVADFVKN
jgi:hypothetical protein